MKRISITVLLSILFLLAMQRVYVRPVFAGPNKNNVQLYADQSLSSLSGFQAVYNGFTQPDKKKVTNNNSKAHDNQNQNNTNNNTNNNVTVTPVNYVNTDPLTIINDGPSTKSVTTIRREIPLSATAPHDVAINLSGTDQVKLSEPILLSGNLKDLTTGTGVPDKSIKIYTNDVLLAQTHTTSDGTYQVRIAKNLPAGKYVITAAFTGAHLLAPATANMSFEILPATVKVQTVPALEGITFKMNGSTFISGKDGIATTQIAQSGQYRLEVVLDKFDNPSEQVQFGRWTEETFQPFRIVQVPSSNAIQVGLNVYHKISLKFVGLDGYSVDPSRITSISIRSVQGDIFTLKPGDSPWLPAIRTARRQTGLEETDLLYSVNSVMIDGSNVVNSAQQKFYAKPDDIWNISLLLYSMHVSAKDALLQIPVGTSVNIVFPSGESVNYALDQSGALSLHALARGIYHVELIGARGLGTTTPVALSRNQDANLRIVTTLDLALFMTVGSGFAIGLIVYGRPWLLQYLSRKRRIRLHQKSKDFGA